ncbi:hypothetical protein [Moraxella lacunata]
MLDRPPIPRPRLAFFGDLVGLGQVRFYERGFARRHLVYSCVLLQQ